jgi:hypothetical protein
MQTHISWQTAKLKFQCQPSRNETMELVWILTLGNSGYIADFCGAAAWFRLGPDYVPIYIVFNFIWVWAPFIVKDF